MFTLVAVTFTRYMPRRFISWRLQRYNRQLMIMCSVLISYCVCRRPSWKPKTQPNGSSAVVWLSFWFSTRFTGKKLDHSSGIYLYRKDIWITTTLWYSTQAHISDTLSVEFWQFITRHGMALSSYYEFSPSFTKFLNLLLASSTTNCISLMLYFFFRWITPKL